MRVHIDIHDVIRLDDVGRQLGQRLVDEIGERRRVLPQLGERLLRRLDLRLPLVAQLAFRLCATRSRSYVVHDDVIASFVFIYMYTYVYMQIQTAKCKGRMLCI